MDEDDATVCQRQSLFASRRSMHTSIPCSRGLGSHIRLPEQAQIPISGPGRRVAVSESSSWPGHRGMRLTAGRCKREAAAD
jgi:hypothetical protein